MLVDGCVTGPARRAAVTSGLSVLEMFVESQSGGHLELPVGHDGCVVGWDVQPGAGPGPRC